MMGGMKRWHEEIHIAKRHAKDAIRLRGKQHRFNNLGRFRKRDGYDCGNPACHLCHSDKFPRRELTRPELRAAAAMREQLSEV